MKYTPESRKGSFSDLFKSQVADAQLLLLVNLLARLPVHFLHFGHRLVPIMYLKLLFTTLLSLLTLPFLANAQIKPGPSKIVCVVDAANEGFADLASEPGWKDPNIQGFLIRQSWASVEPSEGTYDFRFFDQAVQLAQQNGKFIGLALGGGNLSPVWVYKAGARALSSGEGALRTQMPIPWDPVFQAAWASVIEALGDRYDTNPAVAYVVMSGFGRGYGSSLALSNDEANQFEALGGPLFWSHAANDIADLYSASFPHTQLVMATDSVVPGKAGQDLANSVVEDQLESHSSQLTLEMSSSLDQGALPSKILQALVGKGVQVDSIQDLRQELSGPANGGWLNRSSFVEIESHQASLPGASDALTQATRQIAANTDAGAISSSGSPFASSPSSESSPSPSSNSSDSTPSPNAAPSSDTNGSAPPPGAGGLVENAVTAAETAATKAAEATRQAAIRVAMLAAAKKGQPIWVSASSSATIGTGTESDPINLLTAGDTDAAFFTLSSDEYENLVVHFLPGTYYTMGDPNRWAVSTGWQFLGAGQDKTILKIDPSAVSYTGTNKFADPREVVSSNGKGHVLIENMTLDGNCPGLGSQLTQSFAMPAPRSTITVSVADSSAFTVGKWVYLQDSVPTDGHYLYLGLMEVTAIPNSTQVTLKNSEVPAPGTITGTVTAGSAVITGLSSMADLDEGQTLSGEGIPAGASILSLSKNSVTLGAKATASHSGTSLTYGAYCVPTQCTWYCPRGNAAVGTILPTTAHVLVAGDLNGITFGRSGDTIENVTVQNVGRPFYEGPLGICLNGYVTYSGGLVQNCTVKNIWGVAGWIISTTSTNGFSLIGNTIDGNGYSQAYSFVSNNSNLVMKNNSATGCTIAMFSDTGAKTHFTISGNKLQSTSGVVLAGGQFEDSTFSQNNILVTGNGGVGFGCDGVQMVDCTITQNTIRAAAGVTGAYGFMSSALTVGPCSGNVVSNNEFGSGMLHFAASPSFGTQSGNTDEDGDQVDLSLQ